MHYYTIIAIFSENSTRVPRFLFIISDLKSLLLYNLNFRKNSMKDKLLFEETASKTSTECDSNDEKEE